MSDLDRLRTEYTARKRRLSGSDIYSPFNPAHLFAVQQRQRALVGMLRQYGFDSLEGKRILEVGCGSGGVLHELLGLGAPQARLALVACLLSVGEPEGT